MIKKNLAYSCRGGVCLLACFGLSLLGIRTPFAALGSNSESAVIQKTVAFIHAKNPNASVLPHVTELALVKTYAYDVWLWGEGGGTCLLSKFHGKWNILACGGGDMNAVIVAAYGVPSTIANELVSSLKPVMSTTQLKVPKP